MKIAQMTSVHPVEDVRILHRECASLARAGHDVVLVCAGAEPGDRLGVRIRPVRKSRGRFGRMTLTAARVLRAAIAERADICHYHDPELLWVALVLRALGRVVVFDVHEDVPKQVLSKWWIPRPLRRPVAAFVRALERPTAWAMSGIVAAVPSVVPAFPAKHIAVVQNFPTLAEFGEIPERPAERTGPPRVGYFGGISAVRGAAEIVTAIGLVGRADVRLALAGVFSPESLEAEVRTLPGWSRVDWLGWVDRGRLRELLSQVDVGLVTFLPAPNHVQAYPGKLFEYMAAGVPVVASDFPLWREIVTGAGCGLLVDPADPSSIAAAIEELLADPPAAAAMGRRGRQAVLERYNWEAQMPALVALYDALRPGSGAAR